MDNFNEQEGMEEGAARLFAIFGAVGLLIILALATILFII